MRVDIRAARDLEATRTMVRMATALAQRFGLDVPEQITPTRGNKDERAMFQREAVADFLGELVDAVQELDEAPPAPPAAPGLQSVRAWIRDRATVEELASLPGVGEATAQKLKAEV